MVFFLNNFILKILNSEKNIILMNNDINYGVRLYQRGMKMAEDRSKEYEKFKKEMI
jgi:hypothetical protein